MAKKLNAIIITVLFLAIASSAIYKINDSNESQHTSSMQAKVVHVIDGDTIIVRFNDGNENAVRFLGIDFPDVDDKKIDKWLDMGFKRDLLLKCYGEGTEKLREMILEKYIYIVFDEKERDVDSYGRLLGYVYYNNISLSEFMVENGYAVVFDTRLPECSECSKLKTKELKSGCLVEN